MSIVLEINELDDNNSDIYTNDEYKTSESDDKRTKKNTQTICLNMIVKNEADIIRDTLSNICTKISISYWVICDTGSNDNTKQIITDFFNEKKIPGELHDVPWQNFGYNRTKALELAYKKTDFLLHFDADDRIMGNLVLPEPLEKRAGYYLTFGKGTSWKRIALIDNHLKWHYHGKMHEVITSKEKRIEKRIMGDYYIATNAVVSARNKNPQEKFLNDAKICEDEFNKNVDKPRNAFYCAECLRFAGDWEKSIEWYKKTLTLDGWFQEKYWACYQIGNQYSQHKEPEKAFYWWFHSYEYDDARFEACFKIIEKARHTYNKSKGKIAIAFYKLLNPLNNIDNRLFFDNSIHDYRFFTELSILCFYAGDFYTGIETFKRLFDNAEKIPLSEFKLIVSNLRFYLSHINPKDIVFYEKFCKYYNTFSIRKLKPPASLKDKIDNIFKPNQKKKEEDKKVEEQEAEKEEEQEAEKEVEEVEKEDDKVLKEENNEKDNDDDSDSADDDPNKIYVIE
ncbi:MAG: hypothetical protein CL678_06130 [Bdellovibrionaceae bacterium]|nr:hypothetical protein [Pseudobdellovibrionaceae bacterium]